MSYCKNCKHWKRENFAPGYVDDWRGWGTCELTRMHDCEAAHFGVGKGADNPQSQAFALDHYEAYGAVLWSHEAFGCVQFEPVEHT